MTAYNQAWLLRTVLALLREQDYGGRWEVIVCDDGSDDDAAAVVRETYRATGVPARYVWQERGRERRSRSRNNALRLAEGDVVLLMDGDLAVGPDFVSSHARKHGGGERLAVYGTRRRLFLGDLPSAAGVDETVRRWLAGAGPIQSLPTEYEFQRKCAGSRYAWLGCMGCNFSFTRGPETLFDEGFVGWGAEDQEFACRLQVRYGFRLQFEPGICGLHVDTGRRAEFSAIRPRDAEAIAGYVRNVVYFRQKYPDLDMIPACNGLGYFEPDPATGGWRQARQARHDREHVRELVERAMEWCARSPESSGRLH
jgi:glycosyltransferase involved in cell wall biosynthesis